MKGVARMNRRGLVYGVGVNDVEESGSFGGVQGKDVTLWRAMLSRCYSEYTKTQRPTYRDVTCSTDWLYFSKFLEDVKTLKGYEKSVTDGWVLDKDILFKGNKIYSLSSCCFVPPEINGCLTLRSRFRGDLPLGVSKRKDVYIARCGLDGRRVTSKPCKTPEDAFIEYQKLKGLELQRLAEKYKEDIDVNVYNSLINYTFNEND